MAFVEANWNPTTRQIRQFGLACAVLLPFIAWLWSASNSWIGIVALTGVAIATLSFIFPKAVVPVFLGLTIITTPIGYVVGEFAMLLIYGGVVLPMGLVFMLLRRDRLQMKLDRQARSYWQAKPPARSAASYYRQS